MVVPTVSLKFWEFPEPQETPLNMPCKQSGEPIVIASLQP